MINTIVLDIGNVLARFRWKEYLQDCGYSDEVIQRIAKATVLNEFWSEWDRGLRNEEELIAESIALEPSLQKEILRFFEEFEQVVKIYDYSIDFVKQLKENGYKVYLLSNYSRKHFKMSEPSFGFLNHVDGGVISYQVQYIKPEPEIYQVLIDTYHLNPQESVFLDDIQINLDGAKPFGFHTIQVENYEQALEELRNLGVRI